jgi:hypothetical protein
MSTKREISYADQFGAWKKPENGDSGYWMLYDSLEDAVSSEGDGCEIYRFTPKFIGRYKRKAEIVKIKARKKVRRK